MDNLDELFRDMESKGLVPYREDWLEKAIRQHPEKVSLMLARTEPFTFDGLDFLDFAIMYLDRNN